MKLTSVIAGLAIMAGSVVIALPATAIQACTVVPHYPAKVSVKSSSVDTAMTITGCEGTLASASIWMHRTGGYDDLFAEFDGSQGSHWRSRTVRIYDFDELGSYAFDSVSSSAWLTTFDEVPVSPVSTSVRYGTWLGVAASRSGNRVVVTVAASRWAQDLGRVHYSGRVVAYQVATTAHGPWVTYGYAKTDSHGRASLARSTPGRHYYRAFLPDVSTLWGSVSTVLFR